jgi:hypothetical protein
MLHVAPAATSILRHHVTSCASEKCLKGSIGVMLARLVLPELLPQCCSLAAAPPPHLVHLLPPVSQQPQHGRASELALQLTAPQQRVVPLQQYSTAQHSTAQHSTAQKVSTRRQRDRWYFSCKSALATAAVQLSWLTKQAVPGTPSLLHSKCNCAAARHVSCNATLELAAIPVR